MTMEYFAIGSSLSAMVNIETIIATPPSVIPVAGGAHVPLKGGTFTRLLSGRGRRDGQQNGAWGFSVFDDDMTDLIALDTYLFGNLFTASKQHYIITLDEYGRYSPFRCYIDCPYMGESKTIPMNGIPQSVRYDLIDCTLQSVSKSSTYTVTTSDHLVYVDCTSGNVTMNLPALSGVNADVPYRFERSAGANSIVLDPNSTEQINSASTLSTTGVTIIKSGSQWVSL